MIRDIKDDALQSRMAGERAYREREEELLIQLQHKNACEFNLNQEVQ